MSARSRGVLGGCLGGAIFMALALMGSGTASAAMFGIRYVLPGIILISVVLGLVVGAAVGWLHRRRAASRWLGALAGTTIGALLGLACDLTFQGEEDPRYGLLLITAFLGLCAGAVAGNRLRRGPDWLTRNV